jgi:hypothetical protein
MHVVDEDGKDWHFLGSELKCVTYDTKNGEETLTIHLDAARVQCRGQMCIDKFRSDLAAHLEKAGFVTILD